MANKLRLNIDIAKLQGAFWTKSPKTGEPCLVIVPSAARAKRFTGKDASRTPSLYLSLEVVPLKNPSLEREDTHFVVEPTTRDERESGNPPKLPIIGNAREYEPWGTSSTASGGKQAPRPAPGSTAHGWADGGDEIARTAAEADPDMADDEIPF